MSAIETERLQLRKLVLADAAFILKLVNQPGWLENIGDKQVNNLTDAENYLSQGPLKSYREYGFGFYLVVLKHTQESTGICGLIKRECFDAPDIGYAISAEFWGKGYATEAAKAVLEYSQNELKLNQIYGVTSLSNESSKQVLRKVGLTEEGKIKMPEYNELSCFFRLKV